MTGDGATVEHQATVRFPGGSPTVAALRAALSDERLPDQATVTIRTTGGDQPGNGMTTTLEVKWQG